MCRVSEHTEYFMVPAEVRRSSDCPIVRAVEIPAATVSRTESSAGDVHLALVIRCGLFTLIMPVAAGQFSLAIP